MPSVKTALLIGKPPLNGFVDGDVPIEPEACQSRSTSPTASHDFCFSLRTAFSVSSIMIKHWKTNGTRDGKPVALYVTTTDEDIAKDIGYGNGHSLTLAGRQENYRQNPTSHTDHIDFAAGAFVTATRTGIRFQGDSILEIDSIPASLRPHHLGGKDNLYLTAVYEQSLA